MGRTNQEARRSACCRALTALRQNPWLSMSIPTGLGDMRNVLLVRTCAALIGIGGSWGTLSEIPLGVSAGKPVYVVNGWPQPADGVTHLHDAAEAVRQALAELS